METGEPCAGSEEAGLEVRGVVAGEEDIAEREVWVEGTSEAAGQDDRGFLYGERRAYGFLRVAFAHSGKQDLDVGSRVD